MVISNAKALVRGLLLLIPNLLKLIYRLADDPRVPKSEKLILAATAAYVLSPIDLIPDFIPFLGKVDDLVLIALALKRLFNVAGAEVLNEHWDGTQDLLQLVDRILEYALGFLPRRIYDQLVNKVDSGYIDITPPK
ncbi:MAG: YkvA family protein [Methanomassiliicoccales archaeon]